MKRALRKWTGLGLAVYLAAAQICAPAAAQETGSAGQAESAALQTDTITVQDVTEAVQAETNAGQAETAPAVQPEAAAVQPEVPAVQAEAAAVQTQTVPSQPEVPAAPAQGQESADQGEPAAEQNVGAPAQPETTAVQYESAPVQTETTALQCESTPAEAETSAAQNDEAAAQPETGVSENESAADEQAETLPAQDETASPQEKAAAAETADPQIDMTGASDMSAAMQMETGAEPGDTASAQSGPETAEADLVPDTDRAQENAATAGAQDPSETPEASETENGADIADPEELVLETVLNVCLADESNPAVTSFFTRGVYWVAPQVIPEGMQDITDTFFYDDSLLTGDSLAYNQQLATMSFELAVASISSEREPRTEAGYANKSRNLKAYLEDNGFIDFETNDDYKEKMTVDSMGAACAHKRIVDNGKTYTLLVIVPRSAGYEAEWGGNFKMGESGDHEGFANSKDIVLDFAKKYVSEHGIEGDIKVWTVGYSRGGGVTNQVGAALLRDPNGSLGEGVVLTPENLYCYTFGTPKSAGTDGDYEDSLYDHVHNTFELYDIVTSMPPAGLGFDRYGTESEYASEDRKERMLELLEMTNKTVYDLYVSGGDPDGFKPKTIDIVKLLTDRKLAFTDDEASYLPSTQAAFMKVIESAVVEAAGTRENYYKNYQKPLADLAGYFFSHDAQWSELIGGIKESKYAVPMAVSMYVTLLSEKYYDRERNETIQELREAVNSMDQVLADLKGQGIEMGPYLTEKYEKLKAVVYGDEIEQSPVSELARSVSAYLYAKMMQDGLTAIHEDEAIITELTDDEDSRAISHLFTYLLFTNGLQDEDAGFIKLNQQAADYAATFLGNAGSYLVPHYNEVIRSWLRTLDPRYDSFVKENDAQKAGYRRIYIEQPDGSDVTGTVRDGQGNVVAVFKNGKLISSTNDWIRITTCDTGGWLRLPVDDTYKIDFELSNDTVLNIKVSEYSVYENEEVRTETSDSLHDWKGLSLRTKDDATLVVSALDSADGVYTMNSTAAYYLDLIRRFAVSYVLDGGILDGAEGIISRDYEEGTGIKLPAPTREGYRFAYWEGSRYDAGDLFTVTADHVFRAIWEKISDVIDQTGTQGSEPGKTTEAEKTKKENHRKKKTGRATPAGQEEQPAATIHTESGTFTTAPASVSSGQPMAPLTGDGTQIMLYFMLLLISGSTAGCMVFRRRSDKAA